MKSPKTTSGEKHHSGFKSIRYGDYAGNGAAKENAADPPEPTAPPPEACEQCESRGSDAMAAGY